MEIDRRGLLVTTGATVAGGIFLWEMAPRGRAVVCNTLRPEHLRPPEADFHVKLKGDTIGFHYAHPLIVDPNKELQSYQLETHKDSIEAFLNNYSGLRVSDLDFNINYGFDTSDQLSCLSPQGVLSERFLSKYGERDATLIQRRVPTRGFLQKVDEWDTFRLQPFEPSKDTGGFNSVQILATRIPKSASEVLITDNLNGAYTYIGNVKVSDSSLKEKVWEDGQYAFSLDFSYMYPPSFQSDDTQARMPQVPDRRIVALDRAGKLLFNDYSLEPLS